jgi:phenylacetate-CoA ligase
VFVEIKRGCDVQAAAMDLSTVIRKTFEVTPEIVVLPLGTLAKEFEASIKAPRILDKRL